MKIISLSQVQTTLPKKRGRKKGQLSGHRVPLHTCEHCHSEFYARPSAKQKYCSNKCKGLASQTIGKAICQHCGDSFKMRVGPRNKNKFCSIYCSVQKRYYNKSGEKLAANLKQVNLIENLSTTLTHEGKSNGQYDHS